MALPEYMSHLDRGEEAEALSYMEDDVAFLLALPSGQVTGRSRADFERYVAGRAAPPDRVHNVMRHVITGDLEMVYGVVTEGGVPTGAFMSAATLSPQGRMRRYQSFFDREFFVLDWPEGRA